MKRLSIFFILLSLAVLLTSPHFGIAAEGTCHVPGSVSQGHAFPVIVTGSKPFEARFTWREEELFVSSVPNPFASNPEEAHKAEVLLAVPLDAKGSLPLTIRANGKSHRFAVKVAWPQSILKVLPRYVQPPLEVQEKIARDREHSRQALALRTEKQWQLPLARPVPGGITSPFGGRRVFNGQPRAPHKGTDLRSPEGAPVRAAADGIAVLAEEQYYGGNTIYVDHGQGIFSVYCHLLEADVSVGDKVRRGQVIARSGATGRVTGAHLHFGFIVQGVSVDAMPLLDFPPKVTGGPSHSIFEKKASPKKARSKK